LETGRKAEKTNGFFKATGHGRQNKKARWEFISQAYGQEMDGIYPIKGGKG
jgi:hypothetical protein